MSGTKLQQLGSLNVTLLYQHRLFRSSLVHEYKYPVKITANMLEMAVQVHQVFCDHGTAKGHEPLSLKIQPKLRHDMIHLCTQPVDDL